MQVTVGESRRDEMEICSRKDHDDEGALQLRTIQAQASSTVMAIMSRRAGPAMFGRWRANFVGWFFESDLASCKQ